MKILETPSVVEVSILPINHDIQIGSKKTVRISYLQFVPIFLSHPILMRILETPSVVEVSILPIDPFGIQLVLDSMHHVCDAYILHLYLYNHLS
jgi:hypothetical protein